MAGIPPIFSAIEMAKCRRPRTSSKKNPSSARSTIFFSELYPELLQKNSPTFASIHPRAGDTKEGCGQLETFRMANYKMRSRWTFSVAIRSCRSDCSDLVLSSIERKRAGFPASRNGSASTSNRHDQPELYPEPELIFIQSIELKKHAALVMPRPITHSVGIRD